MAEWCLSHGLLDEVAKTMDRLAQKEPKHPSVAAFKKLQADLKTKISEAREEHRRFTESILDALPVSLYVIDRDYRIVTWNHHREIGVRGIPRESAIGGDVLRHAPLQ